MTFTDCGGWPGHRASPHRNGSQIRSELIGKKLIGKLPEHSPERKPVPVINLMDALKRGLAEEGTEKPSGKTRSRSGRSSQAQPSLLLPVPRGHAGEPKSERAEAPKRRKKASA